MKSDDKALAGRGYASEQEINALSQERPAALLELLQDANPVIRTSAAANLIIDEDNELSISSQLLQQLSVEKALYTKLAICDRLATGGIATARLMLGYLGKIGNNQYQQLPDRASLKKSFPLPRDIISRTLGRMNTSVFPVLLEVLNEEKAWIISEALDAIGYMVFYNQQLSCSENAQLIIDLLQRYQGNDLIQWKTILCLSAFATDNSISLLKSLSYQNPLLQAEAQRSLKHTIQSATKYKVMDKSENQRRTKERFEQSFQNGRAEYERQTRQDEVIVEMIEALYIKDGYHIVDLGTGTGYIAFSIARRYPELSITGVDIVNKTLATNRQQAVKEQLTNVGFKVTDGIHLPFEDSSIDCIVTRFALHHFVDIAKSFREFARVLRNGGQLFISDPTPNDNDADKFVDRFMQLVPDGHITFYRKSELDQLAKANGFSYDKHYITSVHFPSKNRTEGYRVFEAVIPGPLKSGYELEVIDNEVWIREKVLNISYIKEV